MANESLNTAVDHDPTLGGYFAVFTKVGDTVDIKRIPLSVLVAILETLATTPTQEDLAALSDGMATQAELLSLLSVRDAQIASLEARITAIEGTTSGGILNVFEAGVFEPGVFL